MLHWLSQIILDISGALAGLFFPTNDVNFDFIRMATALVLMLAVALIILCIPTLLHRDR